MHYHQKEKIRFNDNNAIDSTELYISTDTAVLNNQDGSSIDMKSFFGFLQLRTSTIKTFVILYKKTDSSKKSYFLYQTLMLVIHEITQHLH